jgi:hypothetical protein
MMPARIRRAVLLVGLAVAGAALASCGGDRDSTGSAASGGSKPRGSAQAPAAVASSAGTSRRKQSSRSSGSSVKHETARKPAEPSRAIDRKAAKQQRMQDLDAPKQLDKATAQLQSVCRLVSTSEAATILGTAVQTPVVAKQGPTCLYRTRAGDLTTVSVQAAALREFTAHMRKQRDVAVGTRSGVCGTLGQPMLYLPVGGRRVLAVTGKCEVARQFASHALPRLR